jgi:hypothetical protein
MIEEASGSPEDTKSASIKSTSPLSKSLSKLKESPENDFAVSFSEEGCVINKYAGDSRLVQVPASIKGKPVVGIEKHAFKGNSNIEEVVLPDTIKFINEYAFFGCSKLSKVNIPPQVTEVQHWVFQYTAIKKLILPASVTSFAANGWIVNLESIDVDPANENYTSVDGVLYDKQIKRLLNVPAGLKKKSLKLPNSVEKVSSWSMSGCMAGSKLKTIHIPKKAIIEDQAFNDAGNIEVVRY